MDTPKIYIGIELQHAWRLYTLVALDSSLKLVHLQQGKLPEILAYLATLETARVAVSAPAHLNKGRMMRADHTGGLFQPLPGNHSIELRQAEYDILAQGLPIQRTPAEVSACAAWMRRGFRLYHELESAGFSPFENPDLPRTFLETCSEAVFTCFLGRPPFSAETLQGRIQRQLVLWERRLPVRDPMMFFEEVTRHKLLRGILPDQDILPVAQLNAYAAAFIAYQTALHPNQVQRFGEPEEGFIHLPAPQPVESID